MKILNRNTETKRKMTLVTLFFNREYHSAFVPCEYGSDGKARISIDDLKVYFPGFATLPRGNTFSIGG